MNKKLILTTITTFLLLAGCGKVTPNNTAQQNGQSPLVADTTNSAVEKSPTTTTAPAVVTQGPATTVPSLTTETKNQPYSIITATSQDKIEIQYPQIKGLYDKSKEKAINDLIKSDLLKNEVEEPINFYGDVELSNLVQSLNS